jgi:hypothetical protein
MPRSTLRERSHGAPLSDFDFENLTVQVQRGVVHGRGDDVKTEYSNDDLPLDPDYATMKTRNRRELYEKIGCGGWI